MSKYKLFYFPFPGRGELIRFVFAQAGVEYEDYRIPYEKWVAEIKPSKQLQCNEESGIQQLSYCY